MAENQGKIILYLVVLLGFIGGYLYNAQGDPSRAVPALPTGVTPQALSPFKTLKVDYSVLSDAQYQRLRIFGQFPVPSGATGKSDIFQ